MDSLSSNNLYSLATNNKCTASVASRLDQVGLLQFRVVRWLLGIDINKFTERFVGLSDDALTEMHFDQFKNLLNKKWKIKNNRLQDIMTTINFRFAVFSNITLGDKDWATEKKAALKKIQRSPERKFFKITSVVHKVLKEKELPVELIKCVLEDATLISGSELLQSKTITLQGNKKEKVNGFEYHVLSKKFAKNLNMKFPIDKETFAYIKQRLYQMPLPFNATAVIHMLKAWEENSTLFKVDLIVICENDIQSYLKSNNCDLTELRVLTENKQLLHEETQELLTQAMKKIPSK